MNVSRYLKGWASGLATVGITAFAAYEGIDGDMSWWVAGPIVAIATAKTIGVVSTENTDLGIDSKAKAIVETATGVVIAGLVAAQPLVSDADFSQTDVYLIATAVLGAVGVYSVKNDPAPIEVDPDDDVVPADDREDAHSLGD